LCEETVDETHGFEVPGGEIGKDVIYYCIAVSSGPLWGITFWGKFSREIDGAAIQDVASYDGHGLERRLKVEVRMTA